MPYQAQSQIELETERKIKEGVEKVFLSVLIHLFLLIWPLCFISTYVSGDSLLFSVLHLMHTQSGRFKMRIKEKEKESWSYKHSYMMCLAYRGYI